jgi:hypothetical protein
MSAAESTKLKDEREKTECEYMSQPSKRRKTNVVKKRPGADDQMRSCAFKDARQRAEEALASRVRARGRSWSTAIAEGSTVSVTAHFCRLAAVTVDGSSGS